MTKNLMPNVAAIIENYLKEFDRWVQYDDRAERPRIRVTNEQPATRQRQAPVPTTQSLSTPAIAATSNHGGRAADDYFL